MYMYADKAGCKATLHELFVLIGDKRGNPQAMKQLRFVVAKWLCLRVTTLPLVCENPDPSSEVRMPEPNAVDTRTTFTVGTPQPDQFIRSPRRTFGA
jgi:hypothetical protein